MSNSFSDILKQLDFWADGVEAAKVGADPSDCPYPYELELGTESRRYQWLSGLDGHYRHSGIRTKAARRASVARKQAEVPKAATLGQMVAARILNWIHNLW